MRVKEIMTPEIIGIAESATLLEALTKLVASKVSALVVVDPDGAPVGVLSEGDMMRRGELGADKRRPGWLEFLLGGGRAAEDYRRSHGRNVGEIMTRGAIVIGEEDEIATAVDLMVAHEIKRLVVVRDGKAVGVLSRSDLLKAPLATLPRPGAERSDDEISADIDREIARETWTPRGSIHADVTDGIVTLEGAIADDRLRGALKVLCENVPGVKSVKDKLAWIEPNSGYLVEIPED